LKKLKRWFIAHPPPYEEYKLDIQPYINRGKGERMKPFEIIEYVVKENERFKHMLDVHVVLGLQMK